jgi:hypothetical protein
MDPFSATSIASGSITPVQFEDGHLKTIYAIFGVGRHVQYDEVEETSTRMTRTRCKILQGAVIALGLRKGRMLVTSITR